MIKNNEKANNHSPFFIERVNFFECKLSLFGYTVQ
nr:MAG TPA: hypothetical protein [Caudoviricetes sp.]